MRVAAFTDLIGPDGVSIVEEPTPEIDDTYPLAETGAAFAAMRDREAVGKLVVTN